MAPRQFATMRRTCSLKLAVSYVFDWIMIIGFGVISLAFTNSTPNYHAFSLVDLGISYPVRHETVSTTVLILAAAVAPAIVIFLVCLVFVPNVTGKGFTRSQALNHKLWEWNTGWMGLALSLATALLATSGMKNIFGKPRPDLLSRCLPDLTNIAAHTVGGFADGPSATWVLVNQTICQQTDIQFLNDGFRSFPSGHASTSWAGLLYLTLFLASKFAIGLPYIPLRASLTPRDSSSQRSLISDPHSSKVPMLQRKHDVLDDTAHIPYRDEAAAPPTYLLILVYVPLGAAIFITGTRYFNYRHHGFDSITGTVIGVLTAWFSFRWYHLPVGRGSGWSWGPRSSSKAFGVGIGSHGYVDEAPARSGVFDVEMGNMSRDHAHDRPSVDG